MPDWPALVSAAGAALAAVAPFALYHVVSVRRDERRRGALAEQVEALVATLERHTDETDRRLDRGADRMRDIADRLARLEGKIDVMITPSHVAPPGPGA